MLSAIQQKNIPFIPSNEQKQEVFNGLVELLTELFSGLKPGKGPIVEVERISNRESWLKNHRLAVDKIKLLDRNQVEVVLNSGFFDPKYLNLDFWQENLQMAESHDNEATAISAEYNLTQLKNLKQKLEKRLDVIERNYLILYIISTPILGYIILSPININGRPFFDFSVSGPQMLVTNAQVRPREEPMSQELINEYKNFSAENVEVTDADIKSFKESCPNAQLIQKIIATDNNEVEDKSGVRRIVMTRSIKAQVIQDGGGSEEDWTFILEPIDPVNPGQMVILYSKAPSD